MNETMKILYVYLLSKKSKWIVISKTPLVLEGYWLGGDYRYLVTFKDHLELPKYTEILLPDTIMLSPIEWEGTYEPTGEVK
jgi:hypothetical protein